MKFIKLENSDSREFKEAWKMYESSFPSDERRTLELQKELIKNKKYNFFIVIKDKVLVALVADWDFEDFLFVEHLAVKGEFKRKGIGTELLKEYLSRNKQKTVLEVERPEAEIAIKRIKFYEKIGFRLNTFDYVQPPYGKDKNPVPMFLMTYPGKINEAEFSSIREKLHIVVYGLEKPLLGGQIN
ncbi:GNAT family N-acetyltransferase [Candidatus Woesearchaeota archaeon]|nr:GNAT family N-acetyltransferase [Candidatus Woesearchaeota archaeon]